MKLNKVRFAMLCGGLCFSTISWAVSPPFIALANGEGYQFNKITCTEAAARVLRAQGFERVTQGNPTVFGAYRKGSNYGFKVSVRCMNAYNLVAVTVVTARSGIGQKKANQVLRGIKRFASPAQTINICQASASAEPKEAMPPVNALAEVDCNDPNTMAQCLSTIPHRKINTVIEYLEGIR